MDWKSFEQRFTYPSIIGEKLASSGVIFYIFTRAISNAHDKTAFKLSNINRRVQAETQNNNSELVHRHIIPEIQNNNSELLHRHAVHATQNNTWNTKQR